jgi:hypothetical protein
MSLALIRALELHETCFSRQAIDGDQFTPGAVRFLLRLDR